MIYNVYKKNTALKGKRKSEKYALQAFCFESVIKFNMIKRKTLIKQSLI